MARKIVVFKGLEELGKTLKQNATMKDVENVVKMNTSELQGVMKRDAPVDTGYLKRSIMLEITRFGLMGKVMIQAEYAPYLIYGTRFMAKQDFLRPNFKKQSAQFKKDMDRLVK